MGGIQVATKKKKKTVRKASKKKKSTAKKPRKKTSRRKAAPKRKKSTRTTKKVARRKKPSTRKKTTRRKSTAKKKSGTKRKAAAKKRTAPKRKSRAKKKTSARRKPSARSKRQAPSLRGLSKATGGGVNYRALEAEILKLSDLLQTISKKNKLVRRSLNYLEKEQKKLSKQITDAKRFLTRLKNRSLQVLREFPDNAEDLYYQLKDEFNRLSQKFGFRL